MFNLIISNEASHDIVAAANTRASQLKLPNTAAATAPSRLPEATPVVAPPKEAPRIDQQPRAAKPHIDEPPVREAPKAQSILASKSTAAVQRKSNKHKARHAPTLFASMEQDAYISAEEMANSVFGRKRRYY